jgi:hypothetical protein
MRNEKVEMKKGKIQRTAGRACLTFLIFHFSLLICMSCTLGTDPETLRQMVKDREKAPSFTVTVTFNPNGGKWSDDTTSNKTVQVPLNTVVARPDNPSASIKFRGISGWYSQREDGELFDFATLLTADITLYAQWTFMLTSIAEIEEYLEENSGTLDNPVFLPVRIDLGTTMAANSGWRQMRNAIEEAGQFVELDLSTCIMRGTVFNPDYNVSEGQDMIVSIALPDTATIITGGYDKAGAFRGFNVLKIFSGTGLSTIDWFAFQQCESLAMTSLPQGITFIGGEAFKYCTNLALTELPEGLSFITSYAFSGCTSLALTSLPAGLSYISDGAFLGCTNLALTSLPEGLGFIDFSAFRDCTSLALTSLPVGLTEIGGSVFENCTSLALTELPAGLIEINSRAFSGCTNLVLKELPAGITSIDEKAFQDCTKLALTSLPARITSIGRSAFDGCTNLALTELPEGLTYIGSGAFSGCTGLTEIALTAELIDEILDYAFEGCENLALVTCHAITPPWLGADVFYGTHPNLRIEVPAESVDAYKAAYGWSEYADRIYAIGDNK